jgi:hypothetical protein
MAVLVPRTRAQLEVIVQQRLEESATLEFKRQLPDAGKNEDVATDIAAMANAVGGVIIYGVAESGGRADALTPFMLNRDSDRINLVAMSLDEPVTLDEVFAIQDAPGVGFVVVVISPSERAPHIRSGRVVGRTSKGNANLTRRQLGELFARSKGFAQEFDLIAVRPGRLKVSHVREPRPGAYASGSVDHYLVVENDGETAIHNCRWQWAGQSRERPKALNDPLPISVMEPGASFRIRLAVNTGPAPSHEIETIWDDSSSGEHRARWTIVL